MGTSKPLTGPSNGGWTGAKSRLSRWKPDPSSQPGSLVETDQRVAEDAATRFRRALRTALREDPERFGLQEAARASGSRLVTLLEELSQPDPQILRGIADRVSISPADEFVRRFVAEVGGHGNLIVDAATRRAARRVAERLIETGSPLADATRPGRISGELFCALYQSFFGHLVGEFVHILIAENVKLAVPGLALVDPTGTVAGLVADQIVKILPDPCAAAAAREPERARLPEVARDLLTETVAEALGLGDHGMELAA